MEPYLVRMKTAICLPLPWRSPVGLPADEPAVNRRSGSAKLNPELRPASGMRMAVWQRRKPQLRTALPYLLLR